MSVGGTFGIPFAAGSTETVRRLPLDDWNQKEASMVALNLLGSGVSVDSALSLFTAMDYANIVSNAPTEIIMEEVLGSFTRTFTLTGVSLSVTSIGGVL